MSALRIVTLIAAAALAVPGAAVADTTTHDTTTDDTTTDSVSADLPSGSEDQLAETYYRLLLQNTRFQESTWNEAEGTYGIPNWDVVGTLGNAVLLNFGDYDAELAGVSKSTLHEHTVRSLTKAAEQNRFVDPENGTWGAYIYWDAAMEGYLVAAARLMWEDLDERTRANIDTITRGEADYLVEAGAHPSDDSHEGGTTNGLDGGYVSDTKSEEMGNRSMMLAAADAYLPDDPKAPGWREWLDRWTINLAGVPVADQANPTKISGKPISEWAKAQNFFDTFISENHGSWNGMYQQSAGSYPGRNIVHYLIAGQPVPKSQLAIPSNAEHFRVLDQLGTDAGVPLEHMIGDRSHLYGRSLLPVTYRAIAIGDRMSARAEHMLAERLGPYVDHPSRNRFVKFFEGTKYETEARAEVAMAYLLHYWRDQLSGNVRPISEAEYFRQAAGVTDYGEIPGLVNHQSPNSLMSAITKPGYTKFAFLPEHDDWLIDNTGKAPAFLPSVAEVDAANSRAYTELRDGVDATATVVRRGEEYAGYTTLPDGSVAYATTGTGEDEGSLRLNNLDMPGVPGLDGDRTFRTAGDSVTLRPDGLGEGGTEELTFEPTEARYVRMLGIQAQSQWGYSLYEFEARDGANGDNLALGRPATASSSYSDTAGPDRAVDGDRTTRWANSQAERPTMKGWYAVDLGESTRLDRVTLHWQEDAWPLNHWIQVSDDGTSWRTVATVPDWRSMRGNSSTQWLNLDGRAGFVVRGSDNPIGVAPNAIALSHGPAEDLVIQGFPTQSPKQTARAAGVPQPTGGPAELRAALNGDRLSLFNLSGQPIDAAGIEIPQAGESRKLYRGTQTATANGLAYKANLAAASAAVESPRFSATGSVAGLSFDVADSRTVDVTNGSDAAVARLTVTSVATGEQRTVRVRRGQTEHVTFSRGSRTPTAELATGRISYPSSPLPPGMSDPDLAVDGNPGTGWRPGGSDRWIVVNLAGSHTVERVRPKWAGGRVPSYDVHVSTDGVTWTRFRPGTEARYVSLRVGRWTSRHASLTTLTASGG